MIRPAANALPMKLRDSWPDEFSGCVVGMRDASIFFGNVGLTEGEWAAVATGTVSSVRIDEHDLTDGWHTETGSWFFRRVTSRTYVVPVEPVSVPSVVRARTATLSETGSETPTVLMGVSWCGAHDRTWCFVHDAQLEFTVTCGPPGMFLAIRGRSTLWDEASVTTVAGDRTAERTLRLRVGFVG